MKSDSTTKFPVITDEEFVPMTDEERARALQQGLEDWEAAEQELPVVLFPNVRFK